MITAHIVLVLLFFTKTLQSTSTFFPEKHPSWKLLDHKKCGLASTNRIIGGEDATLGQYPWLAMIQATHLVTRQSVFICGGAILNSKYILTAAHCVSNRDNIVLDLVRVGEHITNQEPDCENGICAPPVQDIKIAEIIRHENYGVPAKYKNDICLLRLEKHIKFNDYVVPICMIRGDLMNYDHTGQVMDVAGWGVVDIKTMLPSKILKTLKVPIFNHNACQKVFKSMAMIGEEQLCAGGVIGKDSCSGDSGGPLMRVFDIDGQPKYYIIGIVSFGVKLCAVSAKPGVYTRVSNFMPWILDHIKP